MKPFAMLVSHSRLMVFALVGWVFYGPVMAQTNFSIIFSNGPVANRLNVLIISEGYTSAQLPQFLIDATNRANDFLAQAPYNEYRSYFNCFALAVASAQSGSDHPSQNNYRNTFFNSSYDSQGISYLVTIPPNDFDSVYSHGQGKVDSLVQQFLPQCDLPILLVNDLLYGGSGGDVLIVSKNSSATEIIRHESGHTLGGLGDEYDTPYPGYPDVEEPNTTRETRRAFIKWKDWIDNSTPLPTPDTNTYGNAVGLFEGAHYHDTGWYRPKLNCKMRTLGSPFCEVCREALVLAIYGAVVPIDAFFPPLTNFSWSVTQPLSFSMQPFQPMTHDLGTRWYIDGVPSSNAGTNLSLSAGFFGNGRHSVIASVYDDTPWVRTDPQGMLQYSISWTLDIGTSDLRLQALAATRDGLSFQVLGTGSGGIVIQSSTNLFDWVSVATNNLNAGQFTFVDTHSSGMIRTFYRAISLP